MSAADVPPAGRDALREALAEALMEPFGPGNRYWAEEAADLILPVVTAWADRRTAEVVARVKAIPTYTLTNDDQSLETVVLADDVLDALSAPSAPPGTPGHVPTDARGVTGRSRQGIGNDDGGATP